MYVGSEQLKELLDDINAVLKSIELVPGKIEVGTKHENGALVKMEEDGKVVANTEVAEELLPTASGFFFGSTNYDEWYVNDLEETKKILEENLNEKYKDWEFEYRASW